MASGDGAGRPCFLHVDDAEELALVALALAALSGLTIIPSHTSSLAAGSWDFVHGGGERCTPLAAALRASRTRDGGSVSLALTKVPSLSSFSLFATVGGGGGFVGHGGGGMQWVPSTGTLTVSPVAFLSSG
jgi:hypothetical protein